MSADLSCETWQHGPKQKQSKKRSRFFCSRGEWLPHDSNVRFILDHKVPELVFVHGDKHIYSEEIYDSACYIIIIYLHMSRIWRWIGHCSRVAVSTFIKPTETVNCTHKSGRRSKVASFKLHPGIRGKVCSVSQTKYCLLFLRVSLYGILKPHNASCISAFPFAQLFCSFWGRSRRPKPSSPGAASHKIHFTMWPRDWTVVASNLTGCHE